MDKNKVTPEYVNNLKVFTPTFLCNFEDNIYDIIFKTICLKDNNNKVILKVENNNFISIKDIPKDEIKKIKDSEKKGIENSLRMIKYHLNLSKLPNNLKLEYNFKVGNQEVKDFLLIEHFFCNNQLLETPKFELKCCGKNSSNKTEYPIDINKYKNLIKNNPNIQGDTFIFVEKKLVIHNKFRLIFSE